MNWQNVSFDWNQARAFLVTAEEGSLSAAARALGLTQPTLSRQVAALEEELGVTLFERVSKSLVLTEAGLALVDHVKAMGEAASRVSLTASGKLQQIEGSVTISATDIVAAFLLPEILQDLRRKAPNLEIRILITNNLSDLRRREADIAIRHVVPDQPDLIARKIRDAQAGIYGSRDYLGSFGKPLTKAEASKLDFVGYGNTEELLQFLTAFGVEISADNVKINSGSGVVAWEYARRGLGLAIMADEIAARCPNMLPAFDDIKPAKFPIWLVTHRELHTSRKIRMVFDHLVGGFVEA